MGDEMLASVCELAYGVAKEGHAPSAMKNYLYLAQRPPRAYSVAQRALDEDAAFRGRVAERATIDNVGEAGYLWLHRPAGWEARFTALNAGVESIDGAPSGEMPSGQRPPMPAAPTAIESDPQPTPATQVPSEPVAPRPTEAPRPAPISSTVSSIEDELSSLRGLVDRLADERQNVRSSVTELEVELETRRAENVEMSTKLSSLRNELTTVQSSESTILLERDRALARVAELETDVARLTADVERMAAEVDGASSEHQAALTDLAVVISERDSLRRELDSVKSDHESNLVVLASVRSERERLAQAADELEVVRGELDTLKSDHESNIEDLTAVRSELSSVSVQRSSLQGELDAVTTDRNSLTGQFNETLAERDQLQANLDTANAELGELRSQLATVEGERHEMANRLMTMDELTADNAELNGRLSVAEQARVDLEGQLEEVSEKWKTTTRQLSVFENVNSQLDTVASERDALQVQLGQATDALNELHGRIGASHEQIRSELTSIEDTFGERVEALPLPVAAPVVVDTEDSTVDDMTDLSISEVDAPDVEVPDLGDVVDTPSFGDGVDFGTDDQFDGEDAELADEADVFDGQGIELDPATLGGRTIGDMFGGDDENPLDADLSTVDAEHTMNGNTSPDAAGLDELLQAAADEPMPGEPVLDASAFEAPAVDAAEDAPTVADDVHDVTDVAPASEGRRQLSIPSGLDEMSFAREVVGSPDIVLLIDGDGAASLGWPHLDVATRRGALVDYLGTLTADTGAAADVVFARPVGGEDALPVSRAVRVRIADAPVAESPIFAAIVDGYPEEWPIAIITNEAALVAQADALEVATLSNDQLLDLFLEFNSEG